LKSLFVVLRVSDGLKCAVHWIGYPIAQIDAEPGLSLGTTTYRKELRLLGRDTGDAISWRFDGLFSQCVEDGLRSSPP
jgi:hypothetical protein